MTERHQLIAYLATLAALVVVFATAIVTSAIVPTILGKAEVFGLGTITGGLIGVLRIPTSRTVTIDNPPSQPVPTSDAPAS